MQVSSFQLTKDANHLFSISADGQLSLLSRKHRHYSEVSRSQLYFGPGAYTPLVSVSEDLWLLVTDNNIKYIRVYQIVDARPILQQVIGFSRTIPCA